VQPLQESFAFLLLRYRLVGEFVTIVERFTNRRPEELFLDRLVLGLGDDQISHHGLQSAALGTGTRRCPVKHFQHAQHALVVFAQKRQSVHTRLLSGRFVRCGYP
jgi:hypothetical protein